MRAGNGTMHDQRGRAEIVAFPMGCADLANE